MKNARGATVLGLVFALAACGGADRDTSKPANSFAAHISQAGVAPTLVASDYATVVQQLYVSYFGRPADTGGFANFKSQMATIGAPNDIQLLITAYNSDARVKNLIDSFGSSAESAALYSGDNTAFISAIYTNVLGRAPDVEGLAFWVGALNGGGTTRARASLDIMAGALSNKTGQGVLDAALVNMKVTVAGVFTDKLIAAPVNGYSGDFAAARARLMLSSLSANTSASSYQSLTTSYVSALAASNVPEWSLSGLLNDWLRQNVRTRFMVSGSCNGSVTDTNSTTSQVTFDGTARTAVTTTSSWVYSTCDSATFSHVDNTYYDSNYNLAGSAVTTASKLSVNGTEFVSFASPTAPLPFTVRVGDNGTIGTATVYTDSTKQSVIGSRTYTYAIEADHRITSGIVNFTARTINPAGQTLLTTQTKYRLSAAISLIAQDIQYGTTSTLHLVKKAQPSFPTVTDTVLGNGAEASDGKVVSVNYTGWLYDITLADRHGPQVATSTGSGPLTFTLGAGSVISGWESGLQGMKVGGKRTLILTSEFGYGSTGLAPLIPANSALVFDVELVSVK
jgi:FKBP-type peptidyl-prolyl cis-trans isomerase